MSQFVVQAIYHNPPSHEMPMTVEFFRQVHEDLWEDHAIEVSASHMRCFTTFKAVVLKKFGVLLQKPKNYRRGDWGRMIWNTYCDRGLTE